MPCSTDATCKFVVSGKTAHATLLDKGLPRRRIRIGAGIVLRHRRTNLTAWGRDRLAPAPKLFTLPATTTPMRTPSA